MQKIYLKWRRENENSYTTEENKSSVGRVLKEITFYLAGRRRLQGKAHQSVWDKR